MTTVSESKLNEILNTCALQFWIRSILSMNFEKLRDFSLCNDNKTLKLFTVYLIACSIRIKFQRYNYCVIHKFVEQLINLFISQITVNFQIICKCSFYTFSSKPCNRSFLIINLFCVRAKSFVLICYFNVLWISLHSLSVRSSS